MDINQNKNWMRQTNIYEVNLRQYTPEGSFKAFAASLARLKNMGIQTLWFMPITPISQMNKKGSLGSYYACSDYTSVNPEFGSMDDWKALVTEAQGMGFKVILDWVANHTGWDHRWTVEHPEYYKKDAGTGTFKKASGMDDIIELDFENKELRHAMIDAMKFWITQTGIDGFRCDLAFWVPLDFWKEAKELLDSVKPLFWLGELDSLEHPDYMQVFDAAYTWTWMQAAQDFYQKGLSLGTLRYVLEQYNKVPGGKAWFTSNHDENSWNGTEFEKYGDAARLFAVFSCTYQGIPLIYSGQELPNKKRLEFFDKDVIQWNEVHELQSFYQTLLTLQSTHPSMTVASEVHFLKTDKDDKVLAYSRGNGQEKIIVFLNFSNQPVLFTVPELILAGRFKNVFSGGERNMNLSQTIGLNAWDFMLFQQL